MRQHRIMTRVDGCFVNRWLPLLACCVLLVSGCASGKLTQARVDFYRGQENQAAQVLADSSGIAGRDQLLYYMEKGLILHQAGKYKESIATFRKAVDLMDSQVISVSRESTSLVTSERITAYGGEYEERLLVHTYLMMDYLLINDPADALVDAKQAMEVIHSYPDVCKDDYFTRALIAHCYDAVGEYNDAYIEYKKLAADMPDPSPVIGRLYQLALRLGFEDDAATYGARLSKAEKRALRHAPASALIVFVAQGRSPVKVPENIVVPPSIRFSFARYRDRTGGFAVPEVMESNRIVNDSAITTDVGAVLKASLRERAARMIAKETARVVAKEAIARKVKDPLAEVLVRLAFFLMEEPDTRCWQTLPAGLTLLRVPLSPGVHDNLYLNTSTGYDVRLSAVTILPYRRYAYDVIRLGN